MKRAVFAAVSTIVGLIMLLSFKTHTIPTTLAAAPPAAVAPPTTTTVPQPSRAGTTATTGPTTSTTIVARTETVTGNAVATRYGPVQVQITMTNGQVTAVDAIEYPTEKARDRQINARAIPALNQEALAEQSADIDMISGATYTSIGYISSLQSALDKADQ